MVCVLLCESRLVLAVQDVALFFGALKRRPLSLKGEIPVLSFRRDLM